MTNSFFCVYRVLEKSSSFVFFGPPGGASSYSVAARMSSSRDQAMGCTNKSGGSKGSGSSGTGSGEWILDKASALVFLCPGL